MVLTSTIQVHSKIKAKPLKNGDAKLQGLRCSTTCQPGAKGENIMISREKFSQWIHTNLQLKIDTKDEITIYGRMLTYHENEKMILVYDTDHRNVFNINLSEIYQITPAD